MQTIHTEYFNQANKRDKKSDNIRTCTLQLH